MERPGATTLRGNPFTLLGPELKVGDKAPDFEAIDNSLKPVTLATTGDGVRIFSVVPSLDTPVCDAQTLSLIHILNPNTAELTRFRLGFDETAGIHSAVPADDGSVWFTEAAKGRLRCV